MVLLCPKCKTGNLIYYGTTYMGACFTTAQMYYCKECGYVGSFVIEKAEKGQSPVLDDLKKAALKTENKPKWPQLLAGVMVCGIPYIISTIINRIIKNKRKPDTILLLILIYINGIVPSFGEIQMNIAIILTLTGAIRIMGRETT